MPATSSSGVSVISSTLVPRVSEPGSLYCFAQRHTQSHPSLRRRSMEKGGRAQQALQCCAVVRCNAHASIDRKTAVLVGQHVFGVTTLQQAPADEGAQNAAAQGGLHLGHGIHINPAGRVEDQRKVSSQALCKSVPRMSART